MCFVVVTVWFIFHLKYDTVWANWIRKVLEWMWGLLVWKRIGKLWKWIRYLEIWKWIQHPQKQYQRKKMYLKRNFFWYFHYLLRQRQDLTFRYRAFGFDNRVAKLNNELDFDIDWEEPYLLSTFIRSIAYPVKRCWMVTKRAPFALRRFLRRHRDNVEFGEAGTLERLEVTKETSPESPSESVKIEFRKSLRKIFSEEERVARIMRPVNYFEYGL